MRQILSLIIFIIFLMLSFSSNAQIADKYIEDEGIADDPDVLFYENFENGFNPAWNDVDEDASITANASKINQGAASTKVIPAIGKDYDNDFIFRPSPEVEEIYVRYYVMFDPSTDWPHHMGGITAKVAGYWGSAGLAPPGDKAFWSSLEPIDIDDTGKRWGFYTYWHEMRSWANPDGSPNSSCLSNDTCYYGNIFVPEKPHIQKGKWYCTEAMLKANTPYNYDGEQAFWVDGELYGHWRTGEPIGNWLRDKFFTFGYWFDPDNSYPFEGYNWRTNSNVKINGVQLQWYFSSDLETTDIVYYDDVVVAKKRIGCINKSGETRDPDDNDGDTKDEDPNPDLNDNPSQFSVSGGCGKVNGSALPSNPALIAMLLIAALISILMIPKEN